MDLPLGIDVSNHQGIINWKRVAAAGVKFAFIKATEGTYYHDPYFVRNWNEAKANGIYRGAYHFAAKAPDARSEADYFYDYVTEAGLEDGDMLCLDQERGGNVDLGGWTLYWLQIIESYLEFKPLLYTAKGYINALSLNKPELGAFPLWLADWKAGFPSVPTPWNVISFWQYSDSGDIDGIEDSVDLNRFNGDVNRIPLLGKPAKSSSTMGKLIDDMEQLVQKMKAELNK